MIDGLTRVLVLAPHTDDGEFGCGGAMARLVESGADVRQIAFSVASRSLPEGFAPDTLVHESRAAADALGLAANALTVHDFEVRTFPEVRQEILELLIEAQREFAPEAVLMPTLGDIHQDHHTIAAEGLRAFKRTTILGYEIPWNQFSFAKQSLRRARGAARGGEGARARVLPLAAAPQLRERGVHPQSRSHARHRDRPAVRRVLRSRAVGRVRPACASCSRPRALPEPRG